MFALLTQRRLRWLGHVRCMEDGRIPKDLLYGQLSTGTRRTGRPMLRFKDVCKRDLKAYNIDPDSWEAAADDRDCWRHMVQRGVRLGENDRCRQAAEEAPQAESCIYCFTDFFVCLHQMQQRLSLKNWLTQSQQTLFSELETPPRASLYCPPGLLCQR